MHKHTYTNTNNWSDGDESNYHLPDLPLIPALSKFQNTHL